MRGLWLSNYSVLVLCAKARDKAGKDVKGKKGQKTLEKTEKVLSRDAWRRLAQTNREL